MFHHAGTLKTLYWALGAHWWKQIIDGDCHEFGPEVFDEGLHGGAVEPGFVKSLYQGMDYASGELGKPLTVDFYTTLHKNLCAHFLGKKTQTLFNADQAGKFRTDAVITHMPIKYLRDPSISEHYFIWEISEQIARALLYRSHLFEYKDRDTHKDVTKAWVENITKNYPQKMRFAKAFMQKLNIISDMKHFFESTTTHAKDKIIDWEQHWKQKVNVLNEYVFQISKELNCPTFVFFSIKTMDSYADPQAKYIQLNYMPLPPAILRVFAENLFNHFNENIKKPNMSRKAKLTLIADLYQKLEWFHFFPDGQGRTDLVLLSKILTENGFHPVILDRPYFSSTATLDEWVEELEKGLLAWEKSLSEIHAQPDLNKNIKSRL